jgi:hypothetical protein
MSMELIGFSATVESFREAEDFADSEEIVYSVGTNVEYAAYVEFGTSHQEAQPYLRPAARQVARDPERYISGSYDTLSGFIRAVALAIEAEATKKAPVDTGNLQGSIRAKRIN